VILALVGVALSQGGPPLATASVDRARLTVGDALVFTIRTRTRSPQPLTFTLPPLAGFAIVATHEVTDVSVGAGADDVLRTTVRQLTLRAERPGRLVIGAVRARQGGIVGVTTPIPVTVDPAAGRAAPLSPPARALLDAARPPGRDDQVALTVVVPGDSVLVGRQFDILVAAWFPRELRLRLRGHPQLSLPTPTGVWSYPEEAPDEFVGSRLVRGRWMDLYVAHRIVFPLEPGLLTIPPASVVYEVPVSFSIFSREERYSLHSDSVTIVVLPLPAEGRPAGDQRLVAEGLALALSVSPAATRADEPVTAVATLAGIGNAPLWPEPALEWPRGFRVYPAETDVRVEPQSGLVAGSKTFSYLVVADSPGTFALPEVRYPYYDFAAGRYAVARAPPQTLVVLATAEPRAARALPPLLRGEVESWPDVLARELGPWGWLALLLGPPLLAWAARRRHPAAGAAGAKAPALSSLGRLEREFHGMLASHVSDAVARDGDGLARALRAAGIESAVADHVMRLRDRVRAARYGPLGVGDAAELAAELEQVLRVLGAEPGTARRRRGAIVVAVLICAALLAPPAGAAQAPTAEALYEAGALRAAADSFASRAAAQPHVAAHWYNLGATLYRAGADGKAVAAWTRAARLAPRDRVIERAREFLLAPDAASDPLLAVGPATPAEWALAAALAWAGLWAAVIARRRRAVLLTLAGLTAGAAASGAVEASRHSRPVAVVAGSGTAVRVAPYGSASANATIDAGAALLVVGRYGRWLEVRRRDGVHGWVLDSEVVPL
jgi:oxygen tolerance protein BatD